MLAVLTLSIGIGVNAVAFNAFNSLFFKPLRFAGSETLGGCAGPRERHAAALAARLPAPRGGEQ